MALTVAEIAARLGAPFEGDGAAEVGGVASLADARPGDLSFLSNPRYAAQVARTEASAVLVRDTWSGLATTALIRVPNPDAAFAQAVGWFARLVPPPPAGVHPTAIVAEGVHLGPGVSVGPHCVLEAGARIGDRTVLGAGCWIGHAVTIGCDSWFYPQVSVREFCRIGDRAIVHNGAVIGSDGFGYLREGPHWKKIPQVGIVVIGDDVEIGANATIDRARFGETRIANGVKIDNLVQVAHNVTIERDTAIAAQTGIAGSARIGQRVQMGGQVGVAGHLEIGDDVIVGAQSGVSKDIPARTFVFGCPAMPHDKAFKVHAHMMRLPELKLKIEAMEARLQRLEGDES
jgi:UDP-3-O-[3-hydroxymyristoyl] glucosamine N-acyltransferase